MSDSEHQESESDGWSTYIEVIRARRVLDGRELSQQTHYQVSNVRPANQAEAGVLFDAIRRH